jgi:hypothetical protein
MTQKDLAEEYAKERLQGRLSGNEISFSENIVFTEDDIKAAFNAGRESVVEGASELDWEDIGIYGEKARYVNVCRAHKPLEEYMIQKWSCPKDIELHGNDFAKSGFKTIEDAKAYAKAAYKQRIKQALEL